jgi:ribosomal protein L24E
MATAVARARIVARTAVILVLVLTSAIPGAQGRVLRGCPCGETYVVQGGESLQMISEKCNDQFILENNPHIVDHDDLFEGQFLKMDCTPRKINLCEITGALPSYFC